MVRVYLAQDNGGAHIDLTPTEVKDLLESRADGISTTATNDGVRIDTDGKGEHTKKLPTHLHQYIHNTDGARFSTHRDNN